MVSSASRPKTEEHPNPMNAPSLIATGQDTDAAASIHFLRLSEHGSPRIHVFRSCECYVPRGVIALHSPEGVVETGLLLCPSEKRAAKAACHIEQDTFSSPV
jgi:hypothetical protein